MVEVLYIGGFTRSGSTIVDRILGAHSGIVNCGEIRHFWDRSLTGSHLCGCGVRGSECSFWSAVAEKAFGGWEQAPREEALRLWSKVDRLAYVLGAMLRGGQGKGDEMLEAYKAWIEKLYKAIEVVSDGAIIVDSSKHRAYAYILSSIPSIRLRLVHLVRDPRGVARGQRKFLFAW